MKQENKEILNIIEQFLEENDRTRFIQSLYALNIIDETDRYEETSNHTLERMNKVQTKYFTIQGIITENINIEGDTVIDIKPIYEQENEYISIADRIQDKIKFYKAQVELGYYITDTLENIDLEEAYIHKNIIGDLQCNYHIEYSDVTGYLWTTEDLKIGGHDIIEELSNHVGKQCKLILTVHKIQPKITKSELQQVKNELNKKQKILDKLVTERYERQDIINQLGNVLAEIYHKTDHMKDYEKAPMQTILNCTKQLVKEYRELLAITALQNSFDRDILKGTIKSALKELIEEIKNDR